MDVGLHVGLIAVAAALHVAGAAVFHGRRDRMTRPERLRTGLLVLASYSSAVVAYDGFLAFGASASSVETVHDFAGGRGVLHGLVVAPGIAALACARWPRAVARTLIAMAAMVPVAWIVFIAAYADVTGEDVGDAGMLVVVLVPTVSAPFLWAGMVIKDAVGPRSSTALRFPAPVGDRSASWQRDPSGCHELRWWNGVQWDDFVADDGEVSRDASLAGRRTSSP